MTTQKQVAIFFEGDKRLRPGFSAFLAPLRSLAIQQGIKLELIACDDSDNAKKQYLNDRIYRVRLLLIDSDGTTPTAKPGWHYMVQAMESWFLADWEKVAEHFNYAGPSQVKFRSVEQLANSDVLAILDGLAKPRKGHQKYHKIEDALRLLMTIRLDQVRALDSCTKFCVGVEAAISKYASEVS